MEENENLLAEKIHGFECHEIDLSLDYPDDPIHLYALFRHLFEDYRVIIQLGDNIIQLGDGDCSLKMYVSLYDPLNEPSGALVLSDEIGVNEIDIYVPNLVAAGAADIDCDDVYFMVTRVTGKRHYPNGGVTATFEWDFLKSKYSIYAPKDMLEPFSDGPLNPKVFRAEVTKLTESDLAGVKARVAKGYGK